MLHTYTAGYITPVCRRRVTCSCLYYIRLYNFKSHNLFKDVASQRWCFRGKGNFHTASFFFFSGREHWNPTRTQTGVFWILARCSYQRSQIFIVGLACRHVLQLYFCKRSFCTNNILQSICSVSLPQNENLTPHTVRQLEMMGKKDSEVRGQSTGGSSQRTWAQFLATASLPTWHLFLAI